MLITNKQMPCNSNNDNNIIYNYVWYCNIIMNYHKTNNIEIYISRQNNLPMDYWILGFFFDIKQIVL